jgi:hypothetical protein
LRIEPVDPAAITGWSVYLQPQPRSGDRGARLIDRPAIGQQFRHSSRAIFKKRRVSCQ